MYSFTSSSSDSLALHGRQYRFELQYGETHKMACKDVFFGGPQVPRGAGKYAVI